VAAAAAAAASGPLLPSAAAEVACSENLSLQLPSRAEEKVYFKGMPRSRTGKKLSLYDLVERRKEGN
jgi:hypothetical protein